MKLGLAALAITAACAAPRYAVTVSDAHAALVRVLTARYRTILSDDGRHVITNAVCRTEIGDRCDAPPDDNAWTDTKRPATTAAYELQVLAAVLGSDGDVRIQLGGQASRASDAAVIRADTPEAPTWMTHEVNDVRAEVDRALQRR